jgi:hypothetical protein
MSQRRAFFHPTEVSISRKPGTQRSRPHGVYHLLAAAMAHQTSLDVSLFRPAVTAKTRQLFETGNVNNLFKFRLQVVGSCNYYNIPKTPRSGSKPSGAKKSGNL